MKSIVALLLCLLMSITVFAACSSDETDKDTEKDAEVIEETKPLLPYGLEFGMSYEEANTVRSIPELERADSGKGYYVSDYLAPASDITEFYYLENDIIRPMYGYSFNEEEVLYEMYTSFTVEGEGNAERSFNKIIDYYKDQTGIQPETVEGDESLEARFDGDNRISIMMYKELDGFVILIVIHNVANQLD